VLDIGSAVTVQENLQSLVKYPASVSPNHKSK
jgi:hypothetical protein